MFSQLEKRVKKSINMQVQNYLLDKQPISYNQWNGSGQEYNSEIYSA